MQSFIPESREEWLKLRLQDVTASEVSALFGTGYMTEYELWHTKAGSRIMDFDSERMRWGRRLEKVIAEGICEDMGWILQDRPVTYFRNPETRMGATPDFFVSDPSHECGEGLGLLQIKNVDGMIFRQKWSEDEAPDFIEMQLQQEFAVTGCTWGSIGALIGGNSTKLYARKPYPQVIAGLEKKIGEFWKSVDEKREPTPDFKKDAEFIMELYSSVAEGKSVDISENSRAIELAETYKAAASIEKTASDEKQSAKAELITLIGDAAIASVGTFKISASSVSKSKGTLVTPEMVGTYVGGRKGYRGFRLTERKE